MKKNHKKTFYLMNSNEQLMKTLHLTIHSLTLCIRYIFYHSE